MRKNPRVLQIALIQRQQKFFRGRFKGNNDIFKNPYSNDNGKFSILVKRNKGDFPNSNDNRNDFVLVREKEIAFLKITNLFYKGKETRNDTERVHCS